MMWIKRDRYDELIRAETIAEMLRVRVNQLEHEKAQVKYEQTGVPQPALEIAKLAFGKPRTKDNTGDDSQPINSIDEAATMFEDVGDDKARSMGLIDGEGRPAWS